MKRSLSVFSMVLLFLWCSFVSYAQQIDSREYSPVRSSLKLEHPQKAMWDIQLNVNLVTATGAQGNAGAVYIPTIQKFWVSRWASSSVYVLDKNGNQTGTFTTSFTGTRTMCFDGQYVVHATNTATLEKLDPTTQQVVGTIALGGGVTARFISYDPTADGGAGGYWTGNWNSGALNYYLVSKTGTVLRTITNTAITGTYGIAYDGYTPGGPFLWVWSQGNGAQNPQYIYQLNYTTGQPTGVQHDIKADFQSGDSAIAGGLFTSTDLVPGKFVLGGVLQGNPDRLFAYEMATTAPPDLTPPTPITNLSVSNATSNSLVLNWSAPSDTSLGGVIAYKIRRSATAITDTNAFNAATDVPNTLVPKPAGQTESFTVDGLTPGTTYYFSIRSRDVFYNWSLISNSPHLATLGAPKLTTSKDTVKVTIAPLATAKDSVIISNTSANASTLTYSVELKNNTFPSKLLKNINMRLVPINNAANTEASVKTTGNDLIHGQSIDGSGGPDSAKYKWIDSNDPNGPQYVWNDISTTGTDVTNWTSTGTFDPKDEGYAGPFNLGFNFKFEKNVKTQVYISSNGFIFFELPSPLVNMFSNAAIPTAGAPDDYIAPFWDDLDGTAQGNVYVQGFADRYVIQFNNWQKYSATGSLTFQVILYSNGKIMFYYNNMNATLNSATVGIENATGTDGLQIAYNADYVANNLAVKISSEPDWVAASGVLSGNLTNGNSAAVKLDFQSQDFPAGYYSMDMVITSNDPTLPTKTIPIKMLIQGTAQPSVTVTAPNGGETWNVGSVQTIKWNAVMVQTAKIEFTTDNGTSWSLITTVPAEKVRSYDPKFGSKNSQKADAPLGTYAWTVPNTPSTQCKVRISDATTATVTDMSDAVFTIKVPPITNVKFEDHFDGDNTVAGLQSRGWVWVNNDGGGTTVAYNGVASVFTSYEGPDTGYVAENYSGANSNNYIDQWLISPPVNVAVGDSLSFWYRAPADGASYPDTIFVRVSPTGDTALASFTQNWGGYQVPPGTWTQWVHTFSTAGTVRFAIQYLIYDGGASGSNSDYIGIDWCRVVGSQTGPTITWQNGVTIKDNGTQQNVLTLGQAPTATNGIDPSLGELSLPPAPPAGVFDARFILPVTPPDASIKDFRNDTVQTATWTINFQPGTAGYPMTFTWNSAGFPTGSFTLQDNVTGTIVNVDMKANSSYTLTNTGITSLKIVFTKSACKDIPLLAGWNILSVPLLAPDMTVATLFPAATSPAYAYNGGYQTVTTLANGKGYWLRYPSATNINVCGAAVTATTIPVVSGWNLIGPYGNDVLVSSITSTPSGIVNSPYYGYAAGYTQPTSLAVGKGYWVRTSAAGVLNIGGTAKSGVVFQSKVEKDWAKIIISDNAGNSSTLYAAKKGANLSQFDLPPVPPTGVFDARFSTQRNVEVLGTESRQIVLNSATYPVTIQVEGVEVKIVDAATNGKLVNQVIKGNGVVKIDNPAVSAIEVQSLEIPVAYELLQNYPNPFNPTTTIKFGLPEKARITLSIYNQLGEKVAVLANGEMEAGYHQYTWNASNMSSGIYFYEIKSDNFTSVKKLILMK